MNIYESIQVYDNGGKTFDRYTIFANGYVYVMSCNPFSPQGINQIVGNFDSIAEQPNPKNKVSLRKLPKDILVAIIERLIENIDSYKEDIESYK